MKYEISTYPCYIYKQLNYFKFIYVKQRKIHLNEKKTEQCKVNINNTIIVCYHSFYCLTYYYTFNYAVLLLNQYQMFSCCNIIFQFPKCTYVYHTYSKIHKYGECKFYN